MKADTYTVNQLSILCRLDRRTVAIKLAPITPEKTHGKHGYELGEALPLLVHEQEDTESKGRVREAKEKEAVAKASISQMEAGLLAGTLCMRFDYVANYSDMVAKWATGISRMKSLTTRQKEEVLAIVRSVKLPPLSDEEDESRS